MFRLLKRLVCAAFILFAAFLIISLRSGGERFRWLGQKVQLESLRVGSSADKIKQAAGKIEAGAKTTGSHLKNTVRKAAGIINGLKWK